MTKTRYALVGTGARAINFIDPLVQKYREHGELVAFCDLSPTRMAYHNARLAGQLGHPAVPAYRADQFEQMLTEQRADQVIVTSKDSTHHDYIVRALRRGCDAITEKPLTTDAEKCREVFAAVAQTGRKVRVAFNGRWSAHRTKAKELILAGTIGRIKSVNLEYILNTDHGADYYRRWHATMADSGGLLVHKSTHHFDLVNWLTDAIPEQVFAYGRLDFYGQANAVARGDEALTRYERYTGTPAAAKDPFNFDLRKTESLKGLYLDAERESGYVRDRNVFRPGIDIYDNMGVLVRYRTGVQLAYTLVCFSSREGMRISLTGDRGRIEYCEFQPSHLPVNGTGEPPRPSPGDAPSESLWVYPQFKPSYEIKVQRLGGGHDGSDPRMAEQLFSPNPPRDLLNQLAGHEQGAASILVGIAGNESIATNRPVDLAQLLPLKPGAKRLSELV